jgi:hypothetical protein
MVDILLCDVGAKTCGSSCACPACIPQQPQPRSTRFRCRLMVLDFHFYVIISVCRTLTRRQQDLCVPRLVSKRPGEQREHMCVLFNMALRIRRGTTRPLKSLLSNPDSEVSALSLRLAKIYFPQIAVHEVAKHVLAQLCSLIHISHNRSNRLDE